MRSHVLTGLFLVVGAAAAVAIVAVWQGNEPFEPYEAAVESVPDLDALERRIERVEASMTEAVARLAELQATIGQQTPMQGSEYAATHPFGNREPAVDSSAAAIAARIPQQMMQSFASGPASLAFKLESEGFTSERANAIAARVDELMLEAMELEADQGDPRTPADSHAQRQRHIGRKLREELGDADYERYRIAEGLLTDVPITRVTPNSPAERAGLMPDDAIVSYNGARVMEFADLEELMMQGPANSQALIEIVRDGERRAVSVPTGPLGLVEPTQTELMSVQVQRLRERTREWLNSAISDRQP